MAGENTPGGSGSNPRSSGPFSVRRGQRRTRFGASLTFIQQMVCGLALSCPRRAQASPHSDGLYARRACIRASDIGLALPCPAGKVDRERSGNSVPASRAPLRGQRQLAGCRRSRRLVCCLPATGLHHHPPFPFVSFRVPWFRSYATWKAGRFWTGVGPVFATACRL